FSTLAAERRTEGTGLFSLMRNVGSSIGISLVIALLAHNHQVNHAEIAAHATPFNQALHDPAIQRYWDLGTLAGRAALDEVINRQAQIIAYADDFRLMMLVTFAALPFVLLLRPPPRRAATAAPGPAAVD